MFALLYGIHPAGIFSDTGLLVIAFRVVVTLTFPDAMTVFPLLVRLIRLLLYGIFQFVWVTESHAAI